jgi:predicted HTH domain antitoxin
MNVAIPDPIAQQAGLDERGALIELAFALYAQDRLSPSQVRRMCGLGFFEFEKQAHERGLPVMTLTEEMLEEDLRTLKELKLL